MACQTTVLGTALETCRKGGGAAGLIVYLMRAPLALHARALALSSRDTTCSGTKMLSRVCSKLFHVKNYNSECKIILFNSTAFYVMHKKFPRPVSFFPASYKPKSGRGRRLHKKGNNMFATAI